MPIPTARDALAGGLPIPQGVRITELTDHADERGVFRELFRNAWASSDLPVQWNVAWSKPNVLRGVHAHPHHLDYLTVISGEMILGLHDFRAGSPTVGLSASLRLQAEDPHLVELPPGVGHGFYFPVASAHVYGVSKPFVGQDAFTCRWDDPALKLAWPCDAPILSARDSASGSHQALAARFAALAPA